MISSPRLQHIDQFTRVYYAESQGPPSQRLRVAIDRAHALGPLPCGGESHR